MTNSNAPETTNFDMLDGLKNDQSLDKKLQNLVKQIDELRTLNDGNDSIDGVFDKKINGALDKGLSKALNKCDISAIDTLIEAIKNISSTPNLPDDIKNSLSLLESGLTRAKESRERNQNDMFDKFNKWVGSLVSAEHGNFENLHRKKDEISAVVDFISNDGNKAGVLSLYSQIQSLDFSKLPKNLDFDNLRTVFHTIKDKYNLEGMDRDKVKESVGKAKLEEEFKDKKANKLAELAENYLGVLDWNGENLTKDNMLDGKRDDNIMFTQEDFVKKFNEVNEERRTNNSKLVEAITIDDSKMNKFSKNDGKLLYDGNSFDVSRMQEVFKDEVNGVLSKGNFLESEGLQAVFNKLSELANADVEKREDEKYEDIDTWEMTKGDFDGILKALGEDKMFIKHEYREHKAGENKPGDRYSYNLKKLKNYLNEVKDKNLSGILELSRSKDVNDVYKSRAAISAVQILLNRELPDPQLVVDGRYRINGKTYDKTMKFQIMYNKGKEEKDKLKEDGKPGKKTITALLGLPLDDSERDEKKTDGTGVDAKSDKQKIEDIKLKDNITLGEGDIKPEDLVDLPEGGKADFMGGNLDKSKKEAQEVKIKITVGEQTRIMDVTVTISEGNITVKEKTDGNKSSEDRKDRRKPYE